MNGLNHLTLAVSCIDRSFDFYINLLGFKPKAKWETGAYLTLGDLWLCLSLDMVDLKKDYTHYAFSIDEREILEFKQKLKQMNVKEWKENSSEGDSIYFLDPDGHKHEVHYGNIETRLASCKLRPYKNMVFYE